MKINLLNPYFALIIFVCMGCSSIEIFKENTEIAPYKAYTSFVLINKEIGMKGFDDDLLDAQVSHDLQEQLEAIGMKYERTNPDLVIRYASNEDLRQKEIYQNRYPMWGWRVWDPWMFDPRMNNRFNTVTTKDYELIQLIVDYIDPKEDKILMRLTAVSESNSPKEKRKRLSKSVSQIVKTYQEHLDTYLPELRDK
ncbi:hypothetical protein P872_07810 [Rhodonellum psychrophilum GCM71 = DSM 17998]|uniref:DUF4136 domain-containing protein n=2 Tax=Rhodonellum TaxID=336827 RepID=U5C0X2_9BACT|nr:MULTISPECIES: DUF4136 domain-containing protein [Rhodonellum]ERM81817.1 hypothetical protein P872_07810 [Rhodonellum psychrophilum GCM71 = DSM 17998]MDO9552840.1 DUF4136 domain-containing protein [Rhodonellum sp.]SDZ27846.1 protein of unknown function [Rhodonellum ikkaensis]